MSLKFLFDFGGQRKPSLGPATLMRSFETSTRLNGDSTLPPSKQPWASIVLQGLVPFKVAASGDLLKDRVSNLMSVVDDDDDDEDFEEETDAPKKKKLFGLF